MLGPQPFSLLQVKRRERKARESALPTILNRARKRITHPPPLSHCSVSFCVLGRAHSCALCAPSGRRGESRRAGDGNPALLIFKTSILRELRRLIIGGIPGEYTYAPLVAFSSFNASMPALMRRTVGFFVPSILNAFRSFPTCSVLASRMFSVVSNPAFENRAL